MSPSQVDYNDSFINRGISMLNTPSQHSLRWIGTIAAAIPCFYLSYLLLRVWWEPMSIYEGTWVRFGVGLMLLEFILLHSGGMVSGLMAQKDNLRDKLKLCFGLFVFYTIMVVTFAYSLESQALLWIFAAVSISRLVNAFGYSNVDQLESQKRIGIGIILYLLVVAVSIFAPIPELGITGDVVAEVYPQRGGGLWEQAPERAIAAAALYFLLLGLSELFILGPKSDNEESSQSTV